MASILGRLYRIGRAYIQSNPDKLEEELKQWEEEIAREQGRKNYRRTADPKRREAGAAGLADAFEALEVAVGADFETCKKAYRKLAKKYHPDKWQDLEKKNLAEKLWQQINAAFERIKKFYGQK